jgi:hypothetical protein
VIKALANFFAPTIWPEQDAKAEAEAEAFVASKSFPEEQPRFKREYSAKIIRGIQVKITADRGYGAVRYNGELTQRDGKWVLFDPDRIADKIIDPVLLPEVTKVVDQMVAADKK